MMPATTPRARYREVLQVLARHGFGFAVRPRFWPFGGDAYDAPDADEMRRPAELRQALEELGTTFIKLGQILSTRPDLLPPAYIAELQKLQDAVPAAPTALITERIEEQLRRPVGELFTFFDPVPLAAASIGQVHAVTLPGGIEAVVKVQRPGVREQVALDLRIAARIAHLIESRLKIEERTGIAMPALVDEFAWTLRNELDYLREAKNAEVFQRNFADNANVRVPAICWEYTTTQIITMERMHGLRIDDVAALDAAGYSPARIAEQSARIVLQEVFEDGFFHADLHPGNLFVLDGGVIGAIDFGMVGTIDEATRTNLLFVLLAIVGQDADQIARYLYRLGIVGGARTNHALLLRDIRRLMAQYYGVTLEELEVTTLLNDLLALVRRYHLRMPPDLALLMKMLVMIEGLGRSLDPTFNILAVAQPFGQHAIARLLAPERLLRHMRQAAIQYGEMAMEFPSRLDRLLTQLERGELVLNAAEHATGRAVHALHVITNRIVQAIATATILLALVLLFITMRREGGGDTTLRVIFFGGIGAVVLLAIGSAVSYWRSRRL
ncbi:MAG: AarF/ABC1/UbiB kinase family protein [Thermomicrobia bacterium]|nr:AarF/ABC1/UbiB kinase family protein [Thermomicrobia bacterium]